MSGISLAKVSFALTEDEKKALAKEMMDEDDEMEEDSDADSDAEGIMPPTKTIPESHWMRATIARGTLKAVSDAAAAGLIQRDGVDNFGRSRLSFTGQPGISATDGIRKSMMGMGIEGGDLRKSIVSKSVAGRGGYVDGRGAGGRFLVGRASIFSRGLCVGGRWETRSRTC